LYLPNYTASYSKKSVTFDRFFWITAIARTQRGQHTRNKRIYNTLHGNNDNNYREHYDDSDGDVNIMITTK
jgi:hypothetical protein